VVATREPLPNIQGQGDDHARTPRRLHHLPRRLRVGGGLAGLLGSPGPEYLAWLGEQPDATLLIQQLLADESFAEIATETIMRRTRLDLGDVERAFRIDVADRYPFLDQDEVDRGLTNMREHWATHKDDCVDNRESTLVIAEKP
jgi:hypothetical protein